MLQQFIHTKWDQWWQSSGHRYLTIGGAVYVFEIVVIQTALWLGASSTWAVALSFSLGLIVSFILQKMVAFRDKRLHHRIVVPQAIAVGCLVLFNFAFTIWLTRSLPTWPPVVTRTIALAITTLWNYGLYRKKIFKNPLLD